MTGHRDDERVRAWLVARDPGPVPAALRTSAARVSYEVRQPIGARVRARLAGLPFVGSYRAIDERRHATVGGLAPSAVVRFGMALAAVGVIATVGVGMLGRSGSIGGPIAPSPSPSPSASPSGDVDVWPTGFILKAGQHDVILGGVAVSFSLPSTDWRSARITGMLEIGSYPGPDYAWVGFGGTLEAVATDPCAGESTPVRPTVADLAAAATTIPGTDAVGPVDTIVGGRPAKVVTLTIHDDVACGPREFWLFGENSMFPNTFDSTIVIRLIDVGGRPFLVYSDQAGLDPAVEEQIQRIVDSIQFE